MNGEIKKVLDELNQNNISYCVLRNYNFLLEDRKPLHSEKSVDMAVAEADMHKFHELLTNLNFTKRKQSFSLKHAPYFKIKDLKTVSFDVQIENVHWNDMPYLNVLKNRVKKSFFYTPDDNDTFVMLLVHSILGKRYFKPEYKKILADLSSRIDRDFVLNKLQNIFNRKIGRELLELSLNGNFNKILKKKYYYVSYFILKSKRNAFTFSKLFFRWLKWKKFFRPYPLISFIGPDGSGKSSMTESLKDYLIRKNRRASIVYTGRGQKHVLPISTVGRIYKGKERKKDRVQKPSQKKIAFRRVLYFGMAPVFSFDLMLRYLLKILPKRRTRQIVITDRYFSDILLMDNVPFFFKKFLFSFFPKPNLTFYLYNSPEELHARRPEESIEGLKRQMYFFDKVNKRLNSMQIKTSDKSKDFERVASIVMAYLYQGWW